MEIEQKDKSAPAHSIEFVEQKDRYIAKLEAENKALREKIKSVESLQEKCKRIADQTSNSFGGNPRREVYEELTEILKNEG